MGKPSARADAGAKAVGPTVNVIAGGGSGSRGKTGDWLLLLLAVGLAALALSGGLEAIWASLLGWLRYGPPAKSGASLPDSGAPAPSPSSQPAQSPAPAPGSEPNPWGIGLPAPSPAPASRPGGNASVNLPSWLLPLAPFLGAGLLQKLFGRSAAAPAAS